MQTNRSCCVPGTGSLFAVEPVFCLGLRLSQKFRAEEIYCAAALFSSPSLLPLLRSFVLDWAWFNWNFIRIDTWQLFWFDKNFFPVYLFFYDSIWVFRDENEITQWSLIIKLKIYTRVLILIFLIILFICLLSFCSRIDCELKE